MCPREVYGLAGEAREGVDDVWSAPGTDRTQRRSRQNKDDSGQFYSVQFTLGKAWRGRVRKSFIEVETFEV